MPVFKCSNGKWRMGQNGDCVFDTKEQAEKAEIAYYIRRREQRESNE